MRYFMLAFLFTAITITAANGQVQVGFGCRLTVDALCAKGYGPWFNWRLAVSGGITHSMHLSASHYYRPSFHTDFTVMQGGSGTKDIDQLRSYRVMKRPANGFLCFTFHPLQYGYENTEVTGSYASYSGKPLYYFSDFTYPVLRNPFKYSISIGTSFAYNMRAKIWQRVAIGNFSGLNWQFTYSNDGPPFAFGKILGDQEDRFFTGDGILNVYNNRWEINNIEFAFHKFTGWRRHNYQVSTALYFTEVSYNDTEQYKYNSGSLSCRMLHTATPGNYISKNTSAANSWAVGIVCYDFYALDIQHLIHYKGYYSHHISPNPPKVGLELFGQAGAVTQ